ncbi:MAG TPA: hypothetical protein DCO72_09020 [Ruminococcus sp.]|nr:hypothetical protein [Ruminococcus sp.]
MVYSGFDGLRNFGNNENSENICLLLLSKCCHYYNMNLMRNLSEARKKACHINRLFQVSGIIL